MNNNKIFCHNSHCHFHQHLQYNITLCNTTSLPFFLESSYKLQFFLKRRTTTTTIYSYLIWIRLLIVVIPFPHIEVSLQYYSILTLSRFEFGHPTLGTIVQLYTLEERTIQYCCKEVLICNKSLAYDLTLRYNYWNCVSERFLETCKFSLSYIPSWN